MSEWHEHYINKREAATRLGVSVRTLERAIAAGLPAYRVGTQVRLLWSDVREYFGLI